VQVHWNAIWTNLSVIASAVDVLWNDLALKRGCKSSFLSPYYVLLLMDSSLLSHVFIKEKKKKSFIEKSSGTIPWISLCCLTLWYFHPACNFRFQNALKYRVHQLIKRKWLYQVFSTSYFWVCIKAPWSFHIFFFFIWPLKSFLFFPPLTRCDVLKHVDNLQESRDTATLYIYWTMWEAKYFSHSLG
jgi:hypothetical protein